MSGSVPDIEMSDLPSTLTRPITPPPLGSATDIEHLPDGQGQPYHHHLRNISNVSLYTIGLSSGSSPDVTDEKGPDAEITQYRPTNSATAGGSPLGAIRRATQDEGDPVCLGGNAHSNSSRGSQTKDPESLEAASTELPASTLLIQKLASLRQLSPSSEELCTLNELVRGIGEERRRRVELYLDLAEVTAEKPGPRAPKWAPCDWNETCMLENIRQSRTQQRKLEEEFRLSGDMIVRRQRGRDIMTWLDDRARFSKD